MPKCHKNKMRGSVLECCPNVIELTIPILSSIRESINYTDIDLSGFSSDQKKRHLFRYSEFHVFVAIFQLRIKRTVSTDLELLYSVFACILLDSYLSIVSTLAQIVVLSVTPLR